MESYLTSRVSSLAGCFLAMYGIDEKGGATWPPIHCCYGYLSCAAYDWCARRILSGGHQESHVVVSSKYVKFLSSNMSYDSIEKLSVQMNKLESEGKDWLPRWTMLVLLPKQLVPFVATWRKRLTHMRKRSKLEPTESWPHSLAWKLLRSLDRVNNQRRISTYNSAHPGVENLVDSRI